MCGQFEGVAAYTKFITMLHLNRHEALAEDGPLKVAPSVSAPVIVQNSEDGSLGVMPMRFGLVPFWYRGSLAEWKASTFNARLEDAASKPVFKGAWAYRHCVVPAEAFYEWSGPKGDRTKWRITRGDNQPLAFAGLWDEAPTQQGDLFSFAILTRPAGRDMQAIHAREPVILPSDDWEAWLRRRRVDLDRPAPLKLVNPDGVPGLF